MGKLEVKTDFVKTVTDPQIDPKVEFQRLFDVAEKSRANGDLDIADLRLYEAGKYARESWGESTAEFKDAMTQIGVKAGEIAVARIMAGSGQPHVKNPSADFDPANNPA